MNKILSIIPARGGSRGIPKKNIIPLAGKPLIEYTFITAKESRLITRILLSTDDEEIAELGRKNGIGVPFLRPRSLAQDDTPTLPVIQHAVKWLEKKEGYIPDYILILQPTSPLRTGKHIDEALEILIKSGADSVVSVIEVPHQFGPHSIMKIVNGQLQPFIGNQIGEYSQRQDKPKFYARNGAAIYAFTHDTLIKKNSLYGDDCRPYIMTPEDSVDIDTEFDLLIAEMILRKRKK